jgi:cytochrome c oxidase cbb3-type subunit 4
MDKYSFLRELADSWVLLGMFIFLIGAWIFAFWPSLSKHREDASMIPFRDDAAEKSCSGICASCKCTTASFDLKGPHNV